MGQNEADILITYLPRCGWLTETYVGIQTWRSATKNILGCENLRYVAHTNVRKRWRDTKNIFRSRQSDLISRQSEFKSRQCDLISRQSDLISRQSELLSRQSELTSRQSDLITRFGDLLSVALATS